MSKILSFAVLAIAVVSFPSAAFAAPFSKLAPFSSASTSMRSPAVTLREVGKQVARNVYQVNPDDLRGRRLVLTVADTDSGTFTCIGTFNVKTGECVGTFIGSSK